jgi:ABC-type glycerol-3-phosphate transport system permease component
MGRLIARCAVWGVGILLVLVAVFPLLWALLNSLKTLLDIVTPTPLPLHADAGELSPGHRQSGGAGGPDQQCRHRR